MPKAKKDNPTGTDYSLLYAGSDFTPDHDEPDPGERGDSVTDGDDERFDTRDEVEDADADDGEDATDEGDDDGEQEDGAEGEEDQEGEGDEDEREGEDEDGAEEDVLNKPGTIPKWRLDQQTKKLREAERESAELKRELEKFRKGEYTTPEQDTSPKLEDTIKELRGQRNELHDQYEVALIDGDSKKAKEIRGKMDDIDDRILDARLDAKANTVRQEATSQSQVEAELNAAADVIQKRFKVFDQTSDVYDEEMVNEVVGYRNALMGMGRKPGEALTEAAETIAKKYDIDEEEAGTVNGKPPPKKPVKKQTVERSKGKEVVQKKQPPKMKGNRNTEKKVDIRAMTERQFERMSEDDKRKLRGDFRTE